MLVLSRKKSESLIIHVNGVVIAEIMIIESKAGRVRIGCKAAENIGIDRLERFERRHPGQLPSPDPLTK